MSVQPLDLVIRRRGHPFTTLRSQADPADSDALRGLLASAMRRDGWDMGRIAEFEMDVAPAGGDVLFTFAVDR